MCIRRSPPFGGGLRCEKTLSYREGCFDQTGYANVRQASNSSFSGGFFMKQVFAAVFMMALAGSAMAQAAGAGAAAGGTVAVVAVGVAGIAAATANSSNNTAANH